MRAENLKYSNQESYFLNFNGSVVLVIELCSDGFSYICRLANFYNIFLKTKFLHQILTKILLIEKLDVFAIHSGSA